MVIKPSLQLMVEREASDLFFTSESPVMIKIDGKAVPVGEPVLTPKPCKDAAYGIVRDDQIDFLNRTLKSTSRFQN
ncbi:MAG: twitching motility protein PilU [Pseudoalteromonas tetraodonis]|jgi:twitching motility protein PilU